MTPRGVAAIGALVAALADGSALNQAPSRTWSVPPARPSARQVFEHRAATPYPVDAATIPGAIQLALDRPQHDGGGRRCAVAPRAGCAGAGRARPRAAGCGRRSAAGGTASDGRGHRRRGVGRQARRCRPLHRPGASVGALAGVCRPPLSAVRRRRGAGAWPGRRDVGEDQRGRESPSAGRAVARRQGGAGRADVCAHGTCGTAWSPTACLPSPVS